MEPHVLNLDKPRKLKYGFKSLRLIKEKYKDKKVLTDVLDVDIDEIPFFVYVGLSSEDESLTPEKVEELLDEAIPERFTVMGVINQIVKAITEQMGVKPEKKKLKTPSTRTVKSRSK